MRLALRFASTTLVSTTLAAATLAFTASLALSACSKTAESPAKTESAKTDASATAPTPEEIKAETDRINEWFGRKYEEELALSPISLTFLGRKEQYDKLDDMSEAADDKKRAWRKGTLTEMESQFTYAKLSDEAKMSYDIWKYQSEQLAAGEAFRLNGYVFDQMNGAQSFLPTLLISFHKVENESDMLAYIARLEATPVALDQLIDHARKAAEQKIRPPKFAFEGVIDQSRKVIAGAPFGPGKDSALWADAKAKVAELVKSGAIDKKRGEELEKLAKAALVDKFKPGYERLIAWEQSDMVNAPENASGVGTTQPNGKAYYEYALADNTTTHMTAEQIHELGLKEVERIRGEMIALKDKVGFKGDLEAFFKFIDTDKQFRFPNTDAGRKAYIDTATAVLDNIKKSLPDFFGVLPKADLVVKRVEPFREQDGAAQHYFPGTPDGSRPGVYYAHLSDMNAMPKPELEVIAYHEGLPGHHMQISIAQELTSVPMFRTQAGFTAYIEGWGLYAEWLAKEMPGTYQDPYSQFGQLSSEMWRAVRLVVDTGLHAKGWTEQQAVEYFDANTSVPLTAVKSEVQRYLIMPGQATAYKIGMIKIQQLRKKAETELGDQFDIKGFHDTVLGGGALPLELLERRVDQWIASKKG